MIILKDGELDTMLGVIEHGGLYSLEIDADDISMTDEVEMQLKSKGILETGFELPPTSLVDDDAVASEILRHVDTWGRVLVLARRAGGRITYGKLDNGRYEAVVQSGKA